MPTRLLICSRNVLLDKDLRRVLSGSPLSSASEVLAIVKGALSSQLEEMRVSTKADCLLLDPLDGAQGDSPESSLPRDELEVKVKFFPSTFDVECPKEAVAYVLEKIGSSYIDSFQVAVPTVGLASLAIGPSPKDKDAEYKDKLKELVQFWKGLETNGGTADAIKKFSICDIETATLETLCDSVDNRPTSVNVNLQSCCVVPPELVKFAQEKGITINTHSDPEVLLSKEDLAEIVPSPHLQDLAGHEVEWIVRYLVMDQKRGVLKVKRYLICLKC